MVFSAIANSPEPAGIVWSEAGGGVVIDWDAVRKVDWEAAVNRPESPLWQSYSDEGHTLHFSEATGLPWDAEVIAFVRGDVCFSGKKLEELRNLLKESHNKNREFFAMFAARCLAYCTKLNEVAAQLARKEYANAPLEDIKNDFALFDAVAPRLFSFLLPMPIADGVLSELVRERIAAALPDKWQNDGEEVLRVVTYPVKENTHTAERLGMLSLARKIREWGLEEGWERNTRVRDELENHLKRYGWIGTRHWWFHRPWTVGDLTGRIRTLLKKDANEQIRHIKKLRVENEENAAQLMSALRSAAASDFERIVSIAKEFAWLRTYRTDVLHSSGFNARHLFFRIAELMGLNHKDVTYLGSYEIRAFLEEGRTAVTRMVIDERRNGAETLRLGQPLIVSGKERERLLSIMDKKLKQELPAVVRGTPAFHGKSVGRARIVQNQFQLEKVQDGDVLVAAMTFPSFILAMERAVAFVTDEGGILCHAAIISREMQKPCVIGTKNATKVFRDGDLVEVDAANGIVRRLGSNG